MSATPDSLCEEVEATPSELMDCICASLVGKAAPPAVLSLVFFRLGASMAVQNKVAAVSWGQLKRSVFAEINDTFDRLVKDAEARRPGA